MSFGMNGRTALLVCVLCTLGLPLGGCETVGQTMTAAREKITSFHLPSFRSKEDASATTIITAEPQTQNAFAKNDNCPAINVIPELNSMHQFLEGGLTRAEDEVSSIVMTGFKKSCRKNENNVIVDLDLRFEGTRGPKAQMWNTNKPGFAYPWFIAVSSPNGGIMAKEVFGVTVAFDQGQNTVIHEEHLRQIIPVGGEFGAGLELLMGFQLTDAELAYNRSLMNNKNNNPALVFDGEPLLSPAPAKAAPMPIVKPAQKPDAPAAPVAEAAPALEPTPTPAPAPEPAVTEAMPATDAPATDMPTVEEPVIVENPATAPAVTESAPTAAPTVEVAPVESPPVDVNTEAETELPAPPTISEDETIDITDDPAGQ